MINDRRHRGNIIYIDFYPKEDFKNYPSRNTLTITLVTDGDWNFQLNHTFFHLKAPFILCLNEKDIIEIKSTGNYAAKTFVFQTNFINKTLTYDSIIDNTFENTELMQDRNLLDIFIQRNECYQGMLILDPSITLQINSWLSIIGAECYSQSDDRWTCRCRRYLLQILFLLEDSFLIRCNNRLYKRESIDYALEYIHSHYNLGLTLDGISKYVGINRTTLNNMCKQKTGTTLIQYLKNYRLKIAKETLTHTNLTLSEISISCGFNYESYFIKAFCDRYGLTPTQYREKYRK